MLGGYCSNDPGLPQVQGVRGAATSCAGFRVACNLVQMSIVVGDARRCGMLSNATGEPLQLNGIWQRKGSRTLLHYVRLRKMVLLCWE